MEAKKFRGKGKEELVKLLKEARLELVKLRLDRKMGSLADGSTIRKKRREIAKILTVLKEKEILGEVGKKEEETKAGEGEKLKTKQRPLKTKGRKNAKKKA